MSEATATQLPTTPRRILLALPAEGLPTQSLHRAMSLSRLLDAELYVLRVQSTRTTSFPLFPQLNGVAALEVVGHRLEVIEATRTWLDQVAGGTFQVTALESREGDFVTQVAERALELGVELVLLPPPEGQFGAMVTELARAAHVPVLVVRAPTSGEVIVAASDLTDDRYPVLRAATALGAALQAQVVAVHNVAPTSAAVMHELSWVLALEAADALSASRLEQLEAATARLGGNAEALVTGAVKDSEAVLEISRMRDADLVVVGTRARSTLAGFFQTDMAARVVEQSARSVLVLPLDGSSPVAA